MSGGVKGNQNLQKAIFTGVFDTLKKSAVSGLNNIKMNRVTDNFLHYFYGFTKEDIKNHLISRIFSKEEET